MTTRSVTLPIIDSSETFVVQRIICIGRNYAEHAREMGHEPEREAPFFFFKPLSALLPADAPFVYPWFSNEVHHELELVVALGASGKGVDGKELNDRELNSKALDIETAKTLVAGFAVGLDMTCRDVQREAKQQGRPWELAKGFDGSAPCSALQAGNYDDLHNIGRLSLTRNGCVVQHGDWRDMVWSVPQLIAHLSNYICLQAGDLIFTGTPAGVGPVQPGDTLVAAAEGLRAQLHVEVIAAEHRAHS